VLTVEQGFLLGIVAGRAEKLKSSSDAMLFQGQISFSQDEKSEELFEDYSNVQLVWCFH
jgi:hypothetical protein